MFKISKLPFLPFSGFMGMVKLNRKSGMTVLDEIIVVLFSFVIPIGIFLGMVSWTRVLMGVTIHAVGDNILPYYDYKGIFPVLFATFVVSHLFLKSSWRKSFPDVISLNMAAMAGFYCSIWQAVVFVSAWYCIFLYGVAPAVIARYGFVPLTKVSYYYYAVLVLNGTVGAVVISYLRTKLFVFWFSKEVGRDDERIYS